jgi:hypothetical protein
MEDASHGGLDGMVVEIDGFWVLCAARGAEGLSGSEQLNVDPSLMTDDELDAAIALVDRHQAIMARATARWGGEPRLAEIEEAPSVGEVKLGDVNAS